MADYKFREIEGKTQKVLYRVGDGVLAYETPAFDAIFETTVEDAYTAETWSKNGSDTQNYQAQMNTAKERFLESARHDQKIRSKCTAEELSTIDRGEFPKSFTAHHDRTSGDGVRNVVMQIVRTEEHKSQTHKGASAMANPLIRSKDYEIASEGESMFDKIGDILTYETIKHPTVTATFGGTVIGTITAVTARKCGASKTNSGFFGLLAGISFVLIIEAVLKALTRNIYIGD